MCCSQGFMASSCIEGVVSAGEEARGRTQMRDMLPVQEVHYVASRCCEELGHVLLPGDGV